MPSGPKGLPSLVSGLRDERWIFVSFCFWSALVTEKEAYSAEPSLNVYVTFLMLTVAICLVNFFRVPSSGSRLRSSIVSMTVWEAVLVYINRTCGCAPQWNSFPYWLFTLFYWVSSYD